MADVAHLETRLEDARMALVAAMDAQRKAQQRYYFTARALHEARNPESDDSGSGRIEP